MDEGKCNKIEKKFSQRLEKLNDNIEGLIDGANLSDSSSINKICELDRIASSYLNELKNHKKGVIQSCRFYEVFHSIEQEFNHLQRRLYTNYQGILDNDKEKINNKVYAKEF